MKQECFTITSETKENLSLAWKLRQALSSVHGQEWELHAEEMARLKAEVGGGTCLKSQMRVCAEQ